MCFMNLCLGCLLTWDGGKAMHWEERKNIMILGCYTTPPSGFIWQGEEVRDSRLAFEVVIPHVHYQGLFVFCVANFPSHALPYC